LCRLLGYVAARPTSVEEVLGKPGLEEFTALTAVHGDGWGMAWQESGDRLRLAGRATQLWGAPIAAFDPELS
jgi:predicted glutamine amidotransferase